MSQSPVRIAVAIGLAAAMAAAAIGASVGSGLGLGIALDPLVGAVLRPGIVDAVDVACATGVQGLVREMGSVGTLHCTLSDALRAALPGTTLLVSAGRHAGPFEIATPGITLCASVLGAKGCAPGAEAILASDSGPAVRILASDVTLSGLTVRAGPGSPGVEIRDASGIRLLSNRFELGVGSDGPAVAASGVSGLLAKGNEFRGDGVGTGLRLSSVREAALGNNVFRALAVGVEATGRGPGLSSTGDSFASVRTAMLVGPDADGAPTGTFRVRGADFASATTAVSVRPEVTGIVLDLALNRWGTDDAGAIAARLDVAAVGLGVTTLPLILSETGVADPPAVEIAAGGNRCAESAFATIQAAVLCARPGATVLVRPSAAQPALPRLESVVVRQNGVGEELDGLRLCSAPIGVFDCDAPAADTTVLDARGIDAPAIEIGAADVLVRGLTVLAARVGDGDGAAVALGDADRALLDGLRIRIQGGGCDAERILEEGACAEAAGITGVRGTGRDVVVSGSALSADLLAPDGTLGAAFGIAGALPNLTVTGSTFRAFTAAAIDVGAPDVTVRGNTFLLSAVAIRDCDGDGLEVLENTFAGHLDAVLVCGAPGPTGIVLTDNLIGLTNARGVHFATGTAGRSVDARCNEWGVYHSVAIRATRVRDDGTANAVQHDPFWSLELARLACLTPPAADFGISTNPA
ncbi:MAG: hypothetical protein ACT4PT_09570, partial [Methanobacteriota archaeon]